MAAHRVVALNVLLVLLTVTNHVYGCTTLFVGRKASADGSVLIAHSSDGGATLDPRIVRIPALTHAKGSLRSIYAAPEDYPRYVGRERQAAPYFPVGNQTSFKPIGTIPQVSSTFGYLEETYAIVNEAGVGFAETTCSAVFTAAPVGEGGHALLSIDALSRIAAERSTTARGAVELMGSLAEKYGWYGPGGGFEGTGETLIVADATEGWVFHILSDPTGKSAIWVAQRVPDDHVTVVANMYTVRQVNLSDSANFLGSSNMHTIAEEKGWWNKSSGLLDFTFVFSDGEYAHKYYSGRRMWRAFSLLNPNADLSPNYTDLRVHPVYPFSMAPSAPVTLEQVQNVMRDHYQGTQFDMTKGLASGPFGTPDRYSGGQGEQQVKGNWERPIGLWRTGDSYVVQFRGWLPPQIGAVAWYGPHAAHGTAYAPFPAGMLVMPTTHSYGHQAVYDTKSAFWAHRYVLNLAQMKYGYIVKDITDAQQLWLNKSLALQAQVDQQWGKNITAKELTSLYVRHAEEQTAYWWSLRDTLMFKYADGWIAEDGVLGISPGYPAWWLRDVGYPNGPPPPPPYHPPATAAGQKGPAYSTHYK